MRRRSGSDAHGARELLADRVSASLTTATAFLAIAVIVTVSSRAAAYARQPEVSAAI